MSFTCLSFLDSSTAIAGCYSEAFVILFSRLLEASLLETRASSSSGLLLMLCLVHFVSMIAFVIESPISIGCVR